MVVEGDLDEIGFLVGVPMAFCLYFSVLFVEFDATGVQSLGSCGLKPMER